MSEGLHERRWLTVLQAAEYAAVHPETIRRALWAGSSGLRGSQRAANGHWRIRRSDLDEWLSGA